MNTTTNTKTKYTVKIQESRDTAARYVDAFGDSKIEAARAALDWAQTNRGYGWNGTATVEGEVFQITKKGAGISIIE
jgi:hypothetical protein